MPLLAIPYHLAVAFWAGGVAIFTFVLTPILFRALSRDEAGRIVGLLFPGYFRWGLVCGGTTLVCLLTLRGPYFPVQLAVVLLMLAATAFQAFFIEPRAAALKERIPSFETTPKDDPRRQEFARLHAVSAVCNLAVFAGGAVLVTLQ